MKKTNKKQIPKVRMPKYSKGGSNTFNESMYDSSQSTSTQDTQDAYNEKRSSGMSNQAKAAAAQSIFQGGMQAYNASQDPYTNDYQKTRAIQAGADTAKVGVASAINPALGMAVGAVTKVGGMAQNKLSATDEYGNMKNTGGSKAGEVVGGLLSPSNSLIGIYSDPKATTGQKVAGALTGGISDMFTNRHKNQVESSAKADIVNQKAQQEAANQQQIAAQQQQQSMMDASFERGMANYNQNNPQGGANNTIQYARYGGQMKFAMGGENNEFAPTSLTTNNIIPAVPASKSTYGTTTTNENMSPSQWKTYNTSQGFTESPIKSKTGYSDFYNSKEYVPQKNTDNDYSFFKTKDVGKVVNYTNDPNYKPIQSYSGKRIADPSNASQHGSTTILRDGRHLRTYADGHTEIVGQPRTTEPLQSLASHKYGGQIKFAMGGMQYANGGTGEINAEVEGGGYNQDGENAVAPGGEFTQFNGPTHAQGGIQTDMAPGTKIYSDKLKAPGTNKTFAKLNAGNNTNREDKLEAKGNLDPKSKTSIDLTRMAKMKNSDMLFAMQEQLKKDKVAAYAKKMGVQLPSMDNESMEQGQSEQSEGEYKYGGIHINPANKGKFTASAQRAGMGTQEFASHVLANKEDYSSTQVKRANFAHNAAGWKHEMGGMQQYAMGGVQLPYYNTDSNGNPKYTNGGKMPKYVLGGEEDSDNGLGYTPNNPAEAYRMQQAAKMNALANKKYSQKSSYSPNVLPWEKTNDSENTPNNPYVNSKVNPYDNIDAADRKAEREAREAAEIAGTKTTPTPEDKTPYDWKGMAGNIANFAAQNAGNIYNLSRYNKPEIEKYERAKASYLDNTAAMRDAEQEARRDEYAVRGASGGNAGTYLANRVGLNTAKVMNKDRIRQQYANANAQIGNQNAQFNTDIAMREVIANAQNRARNRSGKGEAIGDIGQNFGVASKAGKQGEMDQNTLELMMKYYNTPEFQKMMKDNKFKKTTE
jgi:hypothetical protein